VIVPAPPATIQAGRVIAPAGVSLPNGKRRFVAEAIANAAPGWETNPIVRTAPARASAGYARSTGACFQREATAPVR
jgi:hypothetical protein